jgi:hypothetical protein
MLNSLLQRRVSQLAICGSNHGTTPPARIEGGSIVHHGEVTETYEPTPTATEAPMQHTLPSQNKGMPNARVVTGNVTFSLY